MLFFKNLHCNWFDALQNTYTDVADVNKPAKKPNQCTLAYSTPIDVTSPVYEKPLQTGNIYIDPGYQQEKLYAWFETKDVHKIEATCIK